jgi:4'-phosphopantetheinyl transferase EntD
MPGSIDPSLQRELAGLAPPGLLLGHRVIMPGDEDALLAGEAVSIASAVVKVRRASGAARIVARELLAQLGYRDQPVPRSASGAPVWPAGMLGSLAHDDQVAVAAVGRQGDFAAVGIDVEPAEPLPADMLDLVATPREREKIGSDTLRGRLLFAAKETIYKAVYPLDRVFLEFRDIEIDFAGGSATTRTGRAIMLRYCVASHIVVLASIPPA